jgi:hypothetical protein
VALNFKRLAGLTSPEIGILVFRKARYLNSGTLWPRGVILTLSYGLSSYHFSIYSAYCISMSFALVERHLDIRRCLSNTLSVRGK